MKMNNAQKHQLDPDIAGYRAFSISSAFHKKNLMSAFEMAKGYTKPINNRPVLVPKEIDEAQKLYRHVKLLLLY